MIYLILAVLLASRLAGAITYPFQCPLGWGKDKPQLFHTMHLDPLLFAIEQTPSACTKLVTDLRWARDELVKFHESATVDLRTPPEETKKSAEALSKVLAGLIVANDEVMKTGKLCDGTTVDEQGRRAGLHIIRSLYASNTYLAQTFKLAGNVLMLTKTVEEAIKSVKEAVQAEIALADKNFLKTACAALEVEYKNRCLPRPPRTAGQPATFAGTERPKYLPWLLENLESRSKKYLSLLRAVTGERTKFEKLTHPLKTLGLRKDEQPNRNDVSEVIDSFYDSVAPALQLCGLRSALDNHAEAASAETDVCDRFYCGPNGNALFEKPGPARPNIPDNDPFCQYATKFRMTEGFYLGGYARFMEAPPSRGKIASRGSFCPPGLDYPQTAEQGTVTAPGREEPGH